MTLEEKIDAFVLAQGNQVGAGGELAAILKDIVDAIPEPLVVVGTLNKEGYFIPNEGQPSHADAEEAFLNGTPVLLDITDENTPFHKKFLVLSYDVDDKELKAGLYAWI